MDLIATIDSKKLKQNFSSLRKLIPNSKIIAVIKADGYGHDSLLMSKLLEDNNVDFFAVAKIEEALELRKNGIKSEILVLGRTDKKNLKLLEENDIIQTIFSYEYYKEMVSSGLRFRVHLLLDVGMNRLGFTIQTIQQKIKTRKEIQSIINEHLVKVEGVYAHFNNAIDIEYSIQQQKQFLEFISNELNFNADENFLIHMSNSFATVNLNNFGFNAVRIGLLLYGVDESKQIQTKPILNLYSKVISIKEVIKGQSISYGVENVINKTTKIAVLSIGYADGLPRNYSKEGKVFYKNRFFKIVGNITMDYTIVDIEDSDINVGDYVEVIGENISVVEMSNICNTIPYEIFVRLNKRVKRIII